MNQREQLASENGMTIGFVNWFFDHKKDGCGNAWFMMMAAMWEGWSAREAQVKQLTAENAALKNAHPQPFGREMMKALDAYEKHQDDVPETGMMDAFFILRDSIRVETPATDAILASLRAEGVEMFALMYAEEAIKDGSDNTDWKARASAAASEYAAQIRSKSEVQS